MTERRSRRTYARAYIGLVLLVGLALALSYLPLGAWGVPVAIGIASVQSLVIVLSFMHLGEQRRSNAFVLAATLVLLAFFIGLVTADVLTRGPAPPPPPAPAARGRW